MRGLRNFDFKDESDGTQKLFSLAGPWIDSLDNGYVLFIDELHDNLHPLLVQFLVKLFHNTETNRIMRSWSSPPMKPPFSIKKCSGAIRSGSVRKRMTTQQGSIH